MSNLLDFSGKTVLIDGGARGIGYECAKILSGQGAKVIIIDMFEDALKNAVNTLPGDYNAYYVADLSKIEEISVLVKKIVTEQGAIDGFVHCVGARCRRPLNTITSKVVTDVMTINFNSFIELVKCLSRRGCYNEGFSIVGISSISAHLGYKSETVYAATKAAMESAVRCLGHELAPKGVRLNTVVASQINTPVYKEYADKDTMTPEAQYYLSRQYLGLGDPKDVANVIVFLLSDMAKFVSGASVPVDGGFMSN